MSLRRPTVARDVVQTSDCGTHCRLYSIISPLCGVALTPDCGIVNLFLPFEASLQTPDRSSTILLGFREDYRLTSFLFIVQCNLLSECALLICSYASCLHLLYLMSKLSCEYFHSTHLACWFGQMLTKAISWMMSLIASPTPRGVPVSPVRAWIWSLVLYTLPPPK